MFSISVLQTKAVSSVCPQPLLLQCQMCWQLTLSIYNSHDCLQAVGGSQCERDIFIPRCPKCGSLSTRFRGLTHCQTVITKFNTLYPTGRITVRNCACDIEQITTVDGQLFLQPHLILHTGHSQYQILRAINARY